MKIPKLDGADPRRPEGPEGAKRTERERAETRNTGESRSAGDSVEISPRARELARLRQTARELPEVRNERVDEVRKRLEQDPSFADGRSVARAILRFLDVPQS